MKIIKITFSCALLLSSASLLAQRPAMDDRPASSIQQVPTSDNYRPGATSTAQAPADNSDDDIYRPGSGDRNATAAPVQSDPSPEPETMAMPEAIEQFAEEAPMEQQVEQMQTGDTLEIQEGEAVPVQLLAFPKRGMLMDKVKNELGQPSEIKPAIGTPPITTWVYADRVVYFENTHVVHVVARN